MPLPEKLVAKVSSEAAGYVSMSSVERREVTAQELVEQILGVSGKDPSRILEILRRGTLVSGPLRYRWAPIEAGRDELTRLLGRFPDPDPARPFDPERCHLAVLHGLRGRLEIARENAEEKRWFRRETFWQVLLGRLNGESLVYGGYSYSQRADVYSADLSRETAAYIASRADLLRYSGLTLQIKRLEPTRVEMLVSR